MEVPKQKNSSSKLTEKLLDHLKTESVAQDVYEPSIFLKKIMSGKVLETPNPPPESGLLAQVRRVVSGLQIDRQTTLGGNSELPLVEIVAEYVPPCKRPVNAKNIMKVKIRKS